MRKRLEDTEPTKFENRANFVARLRRTVTYLNENNWEHAYDLCNNQIKRANAVIYLRGAKCKW